MISLQQWRDTCRGLQNIRADLLRVHNEVLPRSQASIQRSGERCDRSVELNIRSTERLLDPPRVIPSRR